MRDLHNTLSFLPVLVAIAVADNTPQVGAIVDTANRDALEFAIITGQLTDADATFAVVVEHGNQANLSDAAVVPADELLGTVAAAGFSFADDLATRKLGYVGAKRYVRVTITPAGNASAASFAVVAVLGSARRAPLA